MVSFASGQLAPCNKIFLTYVFVHIEPKQSIVTNGHVVDLLTICSVLETVRTNTNLLNQIDYVNE